MCGEMAGEPLYALVLLGLGFGELSMNAPGIPRVKRILRQVRRRDGEMLLQQLMQFCHRAGSHQVPGRGDGPALSRIVCHRRYL